MPYESLKRWKLLFLTLWIPLSGLQGQEFLFRHFTVEDGLPSNMTYYVYRDYRGFLWICTNKGIGRYNGAKFEQFTTFSGLSDNEVFSVVEDKAKRLWFGSYNGKLCYYKDDTFHNPLNTPFLRRTDKQPHIQRIYPQKDSSVLISFFSPSLFYDISKDQCISVIFNEIRHGGRVYYAEKLGAHQYKVITDSFIYFIDNSSPGRIKKKRVESADGVIGHSSWSQDQPHVLYDLSQAYTTEMKPIRKFPNEVKQSQRPDKTYFSSDGHCLDATTRGLFIDDSIHILPDKHITGITQDLNGNYWLSTLGSGVYSFHKNFNNYRIYKGAYRGEVLYSQEIKGQLFFGTANCKLFHFENGRAECLFQSDSNDYNIQGNPSFLIDTNMALYYFRGYKSAKSIRFPGGFWLPNIVVPNIFAKPIVKKDYKFESFATARSFKNIIKSQHKLFLNTAYYVSLIDLDNYANKENYGNSKAIFATQTQRIFSMAKSEDDKIWFSTLDSFYKVEGDGAVSQHQYKNASFKTFDFFGSFLVGYTHDNQLLVYQTINNRLKKHIIAQECVWENLYRIDETHVLISTNGPYYLLTLKAADTATPYTVSAIEDKFLPLQAQAICVGARECYFFKDGDISVIKKSELLTESPPPVLYFATLKTVKGAYRITDNLTLPYSESGNISISFLSISPNTANLTYQYHLAGKNADKWVNFSGDINLANQPFGTYVVKVRAKTVSSDFSKPITFSFTILRPFWVTWWFVIGCVCVVAALIWLIVKRRIRATVKKKEKEHENHVRFIKSEYKAMNALMNPHFVFNSINNVQSLVNNHEVLNATEYLGVFADLLRQNMHNISNDTIPLQKEIDLVENYLLLEKLRFEEQLTYSIDIADNMFINDIMVPPLLLQPLVENSIKHGILPLKSRGKQGHVHINIYEQGDFLRIEVKDNGIGLTKAKGKQSLHESYGLMNIKNRINQLSIIQGKEILFDLTEILDADGVSQGTMATICMALN
jgi:hypothetical protein